MPLWRRLAQETPPFLGLRGIISLMAPRDLDPIPDASAAYHLWDELFTFGMRLALSTSGDSAEEKQAARERLIRGHQISLEQRDAMWARIIRRMKEGRGER